MRLFEHTPYKHKPVNVNEKHRQEQSESGINQRIAVRITKMTGTMACAWIFTGIALIGLFGLLGWLNPFIFLLMTWLSQQFLQLVFLPIITVGQGVLGAHQEILAEEQFNTTQKSYHDIEQIMLHLQEQDAELQPVS